MKSTLWTLLSTLTLSATAIAATTQDESKTGNCLAQAQAAVQAVATVNRAPSDIRVKLVSEVGQVEVYQDKQELFQVVTNTGRGQDTCYVSSTKRCQAPFCN